MTAIPAENDNMAIERSDALTLLSRALRSELDAVEALLERHSGSHAPIIPDIARHLGGGGKRVRPLVALASAGAARADGDTVPDSVLKLAAAVEFIHSATLLHDDVVDGSDSRRGKAAANNIWGASASILVGDFLFSRAFTLMVDTHSLPVLEILSQASSTIAEGEIKQLASLGRADLQYSEYMEIIDAKTASLFEAAARSAALIVVGDGEICDALGRFGKMLGRAFQLADDILDYGGEESLIGKAVGDDFREGKTTLPLLMARDRANAKERNFWDRVVTPANQRDDDLACAVEMIGDSGAMHDAMALARRQADLACQALSSAALAPGSMRDHLLELARYCVERVR